MTEQEFLAYIKTLKVGERVIETANTCMRGMKGTVYISENEMTKGAICVMWENKMGTSITAGTRRLSDVEK